MTILRFEEINFVALNFSESYSIDCAPTIHVPERGLGNSFSNRLCVAPVVLKVDSAIRWINLQWIVRLFSQIIIRWKVICLVDSAIQRLNNRGLEWTIPDGRRRKENHTIFCEGPMQKLDLFKIG